MAPASPTSDNQGVQGVQPAAATCPAAAADAANAVAPAPHTPADPTTFPGAPDHRVPADQVPAATAAYAAKRPFVTKSQLEEICERFPTPFHLYDETGIRANVRALRRAFSWNKGFREYFAVKATPNPFILDILREEGCGVDCASDVELMLAHACGFTAHDIMFSSNDTPQADFKLAARLGAIVNLDDLTHLPFFEQACRTQAAAGLMPAPGLPGGPAPAGNGAAAGPLPETVCCRFNPGGLFTLSNGIMDNPGDSKYGMTEEQLFQAFRELKARGVRRFGLHAFLASNTVTNEYYPKLAGILFELARRLQTETGAHIAFVNLSGGVGGAYRPDQTPNDIAAIGAGVREAYERILVPAGMGDVAIFTELGRFMLAPYGCLVTRAIHEKHIYKEYVGVDACAVNLMRPAMYGAYHHVTVMGQPGGPDKSAGAVPADRVYDIVGSLCENNDKFAVDRALPAVDRGDLLVVHDTGAHGFSMGYNYNGRLKSAEVLLRKNGEPQLIRRAETPRDYFATFDCFGDLFARLEDASALEAPAAGETAR